MKPFYDRLWLQADIQALEIDFRLTPNNGHSEAHAGLPLLTRLGHGRSVSETAYPVD
jgi:hypothetical protein